MDGLPSHNTFHKYTILQLSRLKVLVCPLGELDEENKSKYLNLLESSCSTVGHQDLVNPIGSNTNCIYKNLYSQASLFFTFIPHSATGTATLQDEQQPHQQIHAVICIANGPSVRQSPVPLMELYKQKMEQIKRTVCPNITVSRCFVFDAPLDYQPDSNSDSNTKGLVLIPDQSESQTAFYLSALISHLATDLIEQLAETIQQKLTALSNVTSNNPNLSTSINTPNATTVNTNYLNTIGPILSTKSLINASDELADLQLLTNSKESFDSSDTLQQQESLTGASSRVKGRSSHGALPFPWAPNDGVNSPASPLSATSTVTNQPLPSPNIPTNTATSNSITNNQSIMSSSLGNLQTSSNPNLLTPTVVTNEASQQIESLAAKDRKRLISRHHKSVADLYLLTGCWQQAYQNYQSSIDLCPKSASASTTDFQRLSMSLEGQCVACLLITEVAGEAADEKIKLVCNNLSDKFNEILLLADKSQAPNYRVEVAGRLAAWKTFCFMTKSLLIKQQQQMSLFEQRIDCCKWIMRLWDSSLAACLPAQQIAAVSLIAFLFEKISFQRKRAFFLRQLGLLIKEQNRNTFSHHSNSHSNNHLNPLDASLGCLCFQQALQCAHKLSLVDNTQVTLGASSSSNASWKELQLEILLEALEFAELVQNWRFKAQLTTLLLKFRKRLLIGPEQQLDLLKSLKRVAWNIYTLHNVSNNHNNHSNAEYRLQPIINNYDQSISAFTPLAGFKIVYRLRLHKNNATGHFPAVCKREMDDTKKNDNTNDDLFIYNPQQKQKQQKPKTRRKKKHKHAESSDDDFSDDNDDDDTNNTLITLVEAEQVAMSLELSNPFDCQLAIGRICLRLADGSVQLTTPQPNIGPVLLPPRSHRNRLTIYVTPQSSGRLIISGVLLVFSNGWTECIELNANGRPVKLNTPKVEISTNTPKVDFLNFRVIKQQPLLRVNGDIAGLLPNQQLMLYEGEERNLWLCIENISSVSVDWLTVKCHDMSNNTVNNGDLTALYEQELYAQSHNALTAQSGNLLSKPLLTGQTIEIPISLFGKISCSGGKVDVEYGSDATDYFRRLTVELSISVLPALCFSNFDISSSSSSVKVDDNFKSVTKSSSVEELLLFDTNDSTLETPQINTCLLTVDVSNLCPNSSGAVFDLEFLLGKSVISDLTVKDTCSNLSNAKSEQFDRIKVGLLHPQQTKRLTLLVPRFNLRQFFKSVAELAKDDLFELLTVPNDPLVDVCPIPVARRRQFRLGKKTNEGGGADGGGEEENYSVLINRLSKQRNECTRQMFPDNNTVAQQLIDKGCWFDPALVSNNLPLKVGQAIVERIGRELEERLLFWYRDQLCRRFLLGVCWEYTGSSATTLPFTHSTTTDSKSTTDHVVEKRRGRLGMRQSLRLNAQMLKQLRLDEFSVDLKITETLTEKLFQFPSCELQQVECAIDGSQRFPLSLTLCFRITPQINNYQGKYSLCLCPPSLPQYTSSLLWNGAMEVELAIGESHEFQLYILESGEYTLNWSCVELVEREYYKYNEWPLLAQQSSSIRLSV